MTALIADRIRGLLKAKRLRQNKLLNVSGGELSQWLYGRDPGTDGLKRLAIALDADANYLIGIGADFNAGSEEDSYALAAAKMSFGYFERDPQVSEEQKRRCRRVFEDDRLLLRQWAPRSTEDWRCLAALIDRAVPGVPVIGANRA